MIGKMPLDSYDRFVVINNNTTITTITEFNVVTKSLKSDERMSEKRKDERKMKLL